MKRAMERKDAKLLPWLIEPVPKILNGIEVRAVGRPIHHYIYPFYFQHLLNH
jgi:hypothetical protein